MQDEALTLGECETFYKLRDALAISAHEWLGMKDVLLPDPEDPDLFDEAVLRDTLDAVFERTDIIDRFVRENPFRFPPEDLKIISSWKYRITDIFTVFEHAGTLLFLADGRIYHVTGLMERVRSVVGGPFPKPVQTTLLPFREHIVYYGFAMSYPVQIGSGLRRAIDGDISSALKAGEHVVDAEDLAEVAPIVAEEKIKREADRMVEELELDMQAEGQLPGHHAGVLAGMSAEEREQAVRAHMREAFDLDGIFDPVAHLKPGCTKGPIRTDLASLIMTEKKATLQGWAYAYGLPHGDRLTKTQLVEGLVPKLSTSDFIATIGLQHMSPEELKNYRALYDSEGVRRVSAEGLSTLKGLPPVMALMCYLFFEDGVFTFVIPEELMGVLVTVDWDGCESVVRDFQRAGDVVDALTCLRGIVSFDEAYDEFRRCYPDAFGALDFETGAFGAAEEGYVGYDILKTGDNTYFVHYDLGNQFRREHGIANDGYPDPHLEGDLGFLDNLLKEQDGKHPRPLDEDMRTSADLFAWFEKRPAVIALRDYLDAHVPDDGDDYGFADVVIEELVEFMIYGTMSSDAIRVYFEILEDHGYVPNEAHLRKVTGLIMNMVNAMPNWANNGWAPDELHGALTGQKVFYNEDGTVRKVGRNEPCPCGSGKKYKRCCGR